MKTKEIIEFQEKYVVPTYLPELLLVKGEGSYVWDSEDRKYLDFSSGISVCNLGHCHPAVTAAITEQAGKLVHVSNLYINEIQPQLAEKLIKHSFDGAVFFGNSGAEANEGLIKLARKWGSEKGKYEIVTMENSFHGRTLTTLAATGQPKYRQGFAPDMPGFPHVPFNDITALEKAINDKTAAVLLEPIQGEGGIICADQDYLQKVRNLCDEKGILLLFDEVQCGMGRTGTFFAYQGYGIEPDAFSLAKALGNGYPIGALIVKRKIFEVLNKGSHASTFGGTPLACAAACAVIDTIDKENILANCVKQGKYLLTKFQELKEKHEFITEVRGKGLMVGLVMEPADKPKELLPVLQNKGMLALTAGVNVLRLLPPLTVTSNEIDSAVSLIDEALSETRS